MNRTAGAIILRISHGYEVKETKDPFVELADHATEQFALATAPGGFLVDLIPACKQSLTPIISVADKFKVRHIPRWLPGTDFLQKASKWASTLNEMVEQPHNYVKQQIVSHSTCHDVRISLTLKF